MQNTPAGQTSLAEVFGKAEASEPTKVIAAVVPAPVIETDPYILEKEEEIILRDIEEFERIQEELKRTSAANQAQQAQVATLTAGVEAMVQIAEQPPQAVPANSRAIALVGKVTGWCCKAPGRFARDFMVGYRAA